MVASSITSVKFNNFKALDQFSLKLESINILVGPNNSGKSTIISAFRILDVALRKAKARKPERVPLPSGHFGRGYQVPEKNISVSLENIATNYNDNDSTIEFRFGKTKKLILFFPNDGGCFLITEVEGVAITTPSKFRNIFPINIQVVPILGPLEHNEPVVTEETVRSSLGTHRASRHFRNYWHYFSEGWHEFSKMVSDTWPEMQIKPPYMLSPVDDKIFMFCSENRLDREIYWAGSGFQIWCQLLTHLSRAKDAGIVIIDEPEIYLHPDVQRQLLGILRSLNTDVLLATHSVEIMGEADPSEILLVDKRRRSAQRLKDIEGIQQAIESVGSAQNVTLTQLARTKRIIFVEGLKDYKIIRDFAQRMGFQELASGNDLTAFESGGFSSWDKVKALSWGLSKTLEADIQIAAVYDRDYFCDEEIEEIKTKLSKDLRLSHIHSRKEIENYFLVPSVLDRVLEKSIDERERRSGASIERSLSAADILEDVTNSLRPSIQGQYISKRTAFFKSTHIDAATVATQTIEIFDAKWSCLQERLTIVPGKQVLKKFREKVKDIYGVNLTDNKIINGFKINEVPEDMIGLVEKMEEFRQS